jgi:hypothetical protein
VYPPLVGLTSLLLQNGMQKSRHEMSRMIAAKQMVHVAKIVITKYGGVGEKATDVLQLLIGR